MKSSNKNTKKRISPEIILSVAEKMFSLRGYRGTSVQEIAKKLKVSKPALYYYFKNKMEILKTLHAKSFEELLVGFKKIMEVDLPVEKKFRRLVENQAYIVAKNTSRVRIFFHDEKEFPKKVINAMKEKRRAFTEELVQLYKYGVREGSFRDINPMIAVYTIMGACNWIHMWYSEGGGLTETEIAKFVSDLLYKGYSTDSEKQTNKSDNPSKDFYQNGQKS
jgi:AcrR family transcriptional regulator